jgi:hypothetical protein
MTATASEPIHLAIGPRTTWYRVPDREAARRDYYPVVARLPGRWSAVLMDGLRLLVVAWSIPFAILLVGTPLALTIALLLWLGRLALSAF